MDRAWEACLVALLTLTVPLAGCLGGGPAPSAPDEDEPSPDSKDWQPNDLLADQPTPYGTTVSDGAEPVILADQDGEFLLIGDTSGIYRSTDGGLSWTDTTPLWAPGAFTDGASIAQDDEGDVYAADLNGQVIQTARSPDGVDWDLATVDAAAPVADRPWLAAKDDGRVGLIYYDFGRTNQEYCLASDDGGQTYQDRTVVSSTPPPNAGNALFDEDGRLFWAVEGTLYQRVPLEVAGQSTLCNGGPIPTELVSNPGDQVFTQVAMADGYPWIGTPSEDEDQLLLASDNGTQSRKTLTFTPTDGEDRLLSNTFLALSGTSEELAVAWYGSETPGDPESPDFEGAWNVFLARIDDPDDRVTTELTCESAGVSCHRITAEPNHVGGICMDGTGCTSDRDLLDYFGIDHGTQGQVHVAYGHDGSTSSSEVRYACVGAACQEQEATGVQAAFDAACFELDCSFDGSPSDAPASATFDWAFGDGSTASGVEVSHTYEDPGTYAVTLTITTSEETDATTREIRVFAPTEIELSPSKPAFDTDEPVRLHANLTRSDTGEPLTDRPVRVVTGPESGVPVADALLTAPVVRSAGPQADVLYHEAQGTTDADGHAVVEIPGEATETGERVNAPTGPARYLAAAEVAHPGAPGHGEARYQVGPAS